MSSQLVQDDPATLQTYQMLGYHPATSVTGTSKTSARVMKPVYNTYNKNDFKVFGYYTDWSQYDGRLDGMTDPNQAGRGYDLAKVDPHAYDKIVIGFVGILGDKGEKQQQITKAASDFGITTPWAPTFTDSWGDVLSYRNCGFTGWVSNDVQAYYNQKMAQGVLGGLRKLKDANPDLRLSFSVGGWTMSEAFHFMAANATYRTNFINGIADIFTRFPMFTEIDLDWEYPSAAGHPGNTYDDSDAPNYALLVKELKAKLVSISRPDVLISIACSADVTKLAKANIPAMITNGVTGINLMTYDFFGTGWATEVAHHTNLKTYPNSPFSTDSAVCYLLDKGVNPKNIYIGFAAYSRNAAGCTITSTSPLKGSYNQSAQVTGMFEVGVSENADIMYNYMDYEKKQGRNGFTLYTDEVADADYLYSSSSQMFLSIDTPRTVKDKAEYVKSKGLGGMFTWTIDQDRGLLVNAAREGLGCTVKSKL
ncbi:glycosyl hydrolase family chitinase [Heterostelium album PN500]|uniref:Glycosyl hydrolase family chitinase n=1 Tax=Heterostelium pallidum (strain ATCC 26659 / Pp 5 / PN500) TaxID=670386 RepID=D3B3E1_HETP5|nr:glycosyl hydrolase family chitinase [Heterostelium album PN500]EFA83839.1 glycosyl hydrolase family chitinase [Heterostelium album PN500]|eukprot:XP_020435956.1 glycosyl hydrolase family chitinase [Heterostelium album PN500]